MKKLILPVSFTLSILLVYLIDDQILLVKKLFGFMSLPMFVWTVYLFSSSDANIEKPKEMLNFLILFLVASINCFVSINLFSLVMGDEKLSTGLAVIISLLLTYFICYAGTSLLELCGWKTNQSEETDQSD